MFLAIFHAQLERPKRLLQASSANFFVVVLYLALVAFLGEYCRILIRVRDVYYTGNVAMALPRTPLKDS